MNDYFNHEVLAPEGMALVQTLTGAGPLTLREAARRVGRDVRAVHSDLHMLHAAAGRRVAQRRWEPNRVPVHGRAR
jgi:predicted transcriptional regulator